MTLQRRFSPKRLMWMAVGVLAVAVGAVGAFLPLLPTTPFLLVAAYAFARSSDRLHRWLLNHRVFGRLIKEWQMHGAINRRAKLAAVMSMVLVVGISVALSVSMTVIVVQIVVLGCSALFILTRPHGPAARDPVDGQPPGGG